VIDARRVVRAARSRWAATVLACVLSGTACAAEITIGVPNWPSVNVTANIIQVILQSRYGAHVELQNASGPVIFEAMAKGSIQILPEVWLPNQQALYDRHAAVLIKNGHPARGVQGICATRAAQDAGIRDVSDLTDPAKARLLDSDADGRGEIFIGAPGWASTLTERLRAHEYGYDLLLQLVEIDEGLAQSQLAVAEKRNRPWVGFCYAPHHWFILHPDLQLLHEPPYSEKRWHVPADGAAASTARVGMGWPAQVIQPVYSAALKDRMPAAATLMKNMDLTSEEISQFAYEVVVNKKDAAEYAKAWVTAHPERVAAWLQ
jgi:glycine betaine/proline transport system substrate-binding protein